MIKTNNITQGIIFFMICFAISFGLFKGLEKSNPARTIVSTQNDPKVNLKTYKFTYKYNKEIYKETVASTSHELAFKESAKKCFTYFTKGQYPGEEKGLDIIDSCANPVLEEY